MYPEYESYRIADIPPARVPEINSLQDRLKAETKEDIVLVAYKGETQKNSSPI